MGLLKSLRHRNVVRYVLSCWVLLETSKDPKIHLPHEQWLVVSIITINILIADTAIAECTLKIHSLSFVYLRSYILDIVFLAHVLMLELWIFSWSLFLGDLLLQFYQGSYYFIDDSFRIMFCWQADLSQERLTTVASVIPKHIS